MTPAHLSGQEPRMLQVQAGAAHAGRWALKHWVRGEASAWSQAFYSDMAIKEDSGWEMSSVALASALSRASPGALLLSREEASK